MNAKNKLRKLSIPKPIIEHQIINQLTKRRETSQKSCILSSQKKPHANPLPAKLSDIAAQPSLAARALNY